LGGSLTLNITVEAVLKVDEAQIMVSSILYGIPAKVRW